MQSAATTPIYLQVGLNTMSDPAKRSLRERRTPKHFDQDGEDPDPYGYARHPYSKDLRTPSQQLNTDAKLLVRFINHSNKSLRDLENTITKKELEFIKEPVAVRQRKGKQEGNGEVQKRGIEGGVGRQEVFRKSKEPYNNRPPSISEQIPQKNDAILNQIKTLSRESASNMRFLQRAYAKDHFGVLPGNSFKDKQAKGPQKEPNLNPGAFFMKDKEKVKKAHELQQKLGLPRSDFGNHKIFKRASYHVAICYHIYLKKLAEKGPIGNDIDPTYYARRLREDMGRGS